MAGAACGRHSTTKSTHWVWVRARTGSQGLSGDSPAACGSAAFRAAQEDVDDQAAKIQARAPPVLPMPSPKASTGTVRMASASAKVLAGGGRSGGTSMRSSSANSGWPSNWGRVGVRTCTGGSAR